MSLQNEKQRTIAKSLEFQGIGLHSGKIIQVKIFPASENTGIRFYRTDIPRSSPILATPKSVFDTSLATMIGSPSCYVTTIEHFMSALYGMGIDNLRVDIDGPEMPIFDGSALPFLTLLDSVGVQNLNQNKRFFVVHKTIEVLDPKNPERFIRIEPSSQPKISYGIDFEKSNFIGKQFFSLDFNGNSFCQEIAFARTFCLSEEIQFIQSKGLARGGSLRNALVVEKNGLLNENGLRTQKEFVKHKILDLIGDLHLNQFLILGHVYAYKAGHDLHTALAKEIQKEFELSQTQKVKSDIFKLFPAPSELSHIIWDKKVFALG